VRIDLHTHSRASDGTQAPGELMRAAAAAGIDVIALTDHDTTDGWGEAAEAAKAAGIIFVPGMEISTRHAGRGVHLLAYLADPAYPPLAGELARILDGRDARVPVMLQKLQALGIDITADDVRRVAGPAAASGRPHVADALIELGVVRDREEAFAEYLSPGRPAYANRYAALLVEMVEIITGAGGVSVVAHPWGRHDRATLDEAALADLADRGMAGIEVDHQDHDPATRDKLRAIARNLGLVATGSSDHHGTGKVGHDLGCNTTDPEEFDRLLGLASAAAAQTGRPVPEVVRP
jgi:3',5'-nucleoside bisphosphate phosphatase